MTVFVDEKTVKMKAYKVLRIFSGSNTSNEQDKRYLLREALCKINKGTDIHKLGL